MKRLLIYLNSMKVSGGRERVIANLINQWCHTYDVTLLVKDNGYSFYELDKNIEIDSIEIPFKLNMNSRLQRIMCTAQTIFKSYGKLKRYFEEKSFDYIYVSTPMNAFELYLMGKEIRNKMIVSEHASIYAFNYLYKRIKRIVYPKVYALSVPTTMDARLYLEKGYNAVHIPHLTTYKQQSRHRLNTKIAITVGRLTSDKQQLLLLKMWNEVFKKEPDCGWKLQIIGSGEEEDTLKCYIQDNNIKSVELIPSIANISEYYSRASLFLFTSRMEGFGMVLLEAMAYGVPCISFDCPSGPRDIIRNGYNGYLIPCFDIEKYKEVIEKVINMSSDNIEKLGEAASETVANWNNEDILKKWDQIFK